LLRLIEVVLPKEGVYKNACVFCGLIIENQQVEGLQIVKSVNPPHLLMKSTKTNDYPPLNDTFAARMNAPTYTLTPVKETDFLKGGVLLIDKPLNWTSFDVVNKVRRLLLKKYDKRLKVGHAGTLDPLATGLLVICTGAFTKRINEFQDGEKEYEGTFVIGATRPSYDKETEINETFPVDHITDEMIQEAKKKFIGEIEQIPPSYSAIKMGGKRAYESAHKGIEVKMSPRIVYIREMEVKRLDSTHIWFRVVCGKGTYIRSLARDFGIALQSGAYLDSLCRTRIGEFRLSQAISMDEAFDLFAVEAGM